MCHWFNPFNMEMSRVFRKIVVDIIKDFGRCFCKATEGSAAEKSAVHAENLGSCAKATPLQFWQHLEETLQMKVVCRIGLTLESMHTYTISS